MEEAETPAPKFYEALVEEARLVESREGPAGLDRLVSRLFDEAARRRGVLAELCGPQR